MKPTNWDEAYKRLNEIEPPKPEDFTWKMLVYDAATIVVFLCFLTFLVRFVMS
jgi:hypothetical protein